MVTVQGGGINFPLRVKKKLNRFTPLIIISYKFCNIVTEILSISVKHFIHTLFNISWKFYLKISVKFSQKFFAIFVNFSHYFRIWIRWSLNLIYNTPEIFKKFFQYLPTFKIHQALRNVPTTVSKSDLVFGKNFTKNLHTSCACHAKPTQILRNNYPKFTSIFLKNSYSMS